MLRAGFAVDDDKPLIAGRARRWWFSFPSEEDRNRQAAVEAAATFLREHSSELPTGAAPPNTIQLAVLAIRLHELFLRRDEDSGRTVVAIPDLGEVRAEVTRHVGAGWCRNLLDVTSGAGFEAGGADWVASSSRAGS